MASPVFSGFRPRPSPTCVLLSIAMAMSAGCTGTVSSGDGDGDGDDGEEPCVDDQNSAPARPTVTSPQPGRQDILADVVAIQTSTFDDTDPGDAHVQSRFEIWRMAGGEPVLRVWSADVEDETKLTSVTLADGTFEVGEGLDEWTDYGVTVRYRDGATCSAWSEWSPPLAFRTDDGSTFWFGDPSTVRDVQIYIPEASWGDINAQASPPGCVPYVRRYYTGSVVLDGVRYDGVGVRTKGGCGSSRNLDAKASFKINLSWNDPDVPGCPAERRSHGLKRLTLNNQVQDRSFVHERLAYHFYKLMGVPTPRASHARVFVNDVLYGLYVNLESIDRRFLSRWFGSNDGMLYEGTYFCDLVPANVPPGDQDDRCISRKFHPSECESPGPGGDPEDYTAIRELATQLEGLPVGAFYPEIEGLFDFDTFLSMWAAESVMGHWDGYAVRIVNNYRIYHDPSTDLWTIIPTGVDQTFVESVSVEEVAGLVAQRCFQEEDCRAAFTARLAQATDIFEQADLGTMAESLRATLDPLVAEDPRKEGSYEEFQAGVDGTVQFIDRRPAELRSSLGL